MKALLPAIALLVLTCGAASAKVQPVPLVGAQITIADGGVGTYCFDSLDALRLSEDKLNQWGGDTMDAFLGVHSLGFYGGEKAKVLAALPTYTWRDDRVKPIQLLIESPHSEAGKNWQGRKCWWEFSQNASMLPQFTSWK